ncbi:MAG TPA: nucleotidyltransferase family protein [Mucilaginibacter sp.]|jgi:predicted nucleotidyltransferase|nr:nucleotidyltransferase family protein [Mucilaginibacter sp.]
MFSTAEIESKLQAIKPELAEKFHVSSIGYFGSYAKGQQTETSDLDLVVEFSQPVGWSFFTLENFLEQSLGLSIDLITRNGLKERIKASILNQVKYI